jgi:ankyrin repeat protein
VLQHTSPSLQVLLDRAKEGNSAQAVKAYLDAGGSPIARLQRGAQHMALLHYMAFCSTHPHSELAESVRLLVAAGADINIITATEPDGYTALMCAVTRECCTTPLQVLLNHGADACMRSSNYGKTALHQAAGAGRADSCALLLAKETSLIHLKDADGITALSCAVISGSSQAVAVIVQHGADVNAVDDCGMTVLKEACMHNQIDVVRYLIQEGADVNAADSESHCALYVAVMSNNTMLAQLLLDHGALINRTDASGQTVMFMATHEGHVSMMELLAERGLRTTAVDNDNNTLLMEAVVTGQIAAAEWLLQHGVAVNAAHRLGFTALHRACEHSSSSSSSRDETTMIELLLANGADVSKCNTSGSTALNYVAGNGHLEYAKVLIAAGADVNHSNSNGLTVLHVAIIKNHAAVVQLILEHCAAAAVSSAATIVYSAGDSNTVTPLMLCTIVDTVKVLLAAGADVHVTNMIGDNCLHTAVRHNLPIPVICL